MKTSKRYFNQKFIALMTIILGSLGLAFMNIIDQTYLTATILISYGIFAGLETFTFENGKIIINDVGDKVRIE